MVTYAPRYGEQEIPHGSVRRPMALHLPASSRAHGTRTPQVSRLASDPRHRLLSAKERLPLQTDSVIQRRMAGATLAGNLKE